MTAIGIVLIIIGTIFMIGSFFVSEKLSGAEIGEMSKLSQIEMRRMLEKELESAENEINQKISEEVDKAVGAAIDDVERKVDKETNEKIMAIDDFSNTIIENMNKTHDEIMFLYGMLNDKQSSISEASEEIKKLIDQSKESEMNMSKAMDQWSSHNSSQNDIQENDRSFVNEQKNLNLSGMDDTFNQIIKMEEDNNQKVELNSGIEEVKDVIDDENMNHNQEILSLHKKGKSNVEIAKKLKLGMGEVKLVLDLFREEEK